MFSASFAKKLQPKESKLSAPSSSSLSAYAASLNSPLTLTLDLHHEFLQIQEEASLEQTSFFVNNQTHNEQVLRSLLEQLGLKTPVGGDNDTTITKVHSHTSETISLDNTVIVSVGTSSTQMFSRRGVLGCVYAGYSGLIVSSTLMQQLVNYVFARIDESPHKNLFKFIVFTNAISYLSSTHVVLNERSCSASPAIEIQGGTSTDKANEQLQQQQTLRVFREAVLAYALNNRESVAAKIPTVLQSRKLSKFSYTWLELKAQQLGAAHSSGSEIGESNSCNTNDENANVGIYVVDFGGGGPVLCHFDVQSQALKVVHKDRIFRTLQDEFVKQMCCSSSGTPTTTTSFRTSPFYIQLIEVLKRNVFMHVWSRNAAAPIMSSSSSSSASRPATATAGSDTEVGIESLAIDDFEGQAEEGVGSQSLYDGALFEPATPNSVTCFIVQTGKARQQFFLGHSEQSVL